MGYVFKFGTYGEYINLRNLHLPNEASNNGAAPTSGTGISGSILLAPWELKHITSFNESIQSQSVATVGIPDKPAECVHIFDNSGVIRQFSISGVRYDSEEEVPNIDFIYSQFCRRTQYEISYIPFTGGVIQPSSNYYSVGLEWLTSTMQSTMRGYTFEILKTEEDSRLPGEELNLDSGLIGQQFNVGLSEFQFQYSPDTPGMITYSLKLVERIKYPKGPIYREYTPSYIKV